MLDLRPRMGDDGQMTSPDAALGWIADRRAVVAERLAGVESRLDAVRAARGEWIDEEHDPEGFALTFEWQQAEGSRADHLRELAELDAAEARVHAGTFGVCEVCGQPIPAAQLELRPARTMCVACVERRG
jgi:RNA polymerase-binding transcription factor DksA